MNDVTASSTRPTSRRPSARARHAAKLRADGLTWRQVGAALRPPCGVRQAQRLAALAVAAARSAGAAGDPGVGPQGTAGAEAQAQADAAIQAGIRDGTLGGQRQPTSRVRFISCPSNGYGVQDGRFTTPPDEWLARQKRIPAADLDSDLVRMHPPADYPEAVPAKGRLIEPRLVARHLEEGWRIATQAPAAEAA